MCLHPEEIPPVPDLTRADYLEYIVRHNGSPSITRKDSEFLAPTQQKTEPQPCITRQGEPYQMSDEAAKTVC
ncbi:hypothetical protein FM036_28275 [Nostoc sp. HG1]|nr:hypothetical protein [Nostoc sp. HG1]